MHTLRHLVDDDLLWFDLLKTFAVNNAKTNVNTDDFIKHVENKTGSNLSYFFQQYFYDHRQPRLEYYQKDEKLYYRWSDVVDGFKMPIDVDINGKEERILPTIEIQFKEIPAHSVVHVRDWEFFLKKKKNPELAG